jgi:hypothetical protein
MAALQTIPVFMVKYGKPKKRLGRARRLHQKSTFFGLRQPTSTLPTANKQAQKTERGASHTKAWYAPPSANSFKRLAY